MSLAEYYFLDPRLSLIPTEHLTPRGMSTDFAALLAERRGWSSARIALFNEGFALYWARAAAMAARSRRWAPPRLRNVGVVADPSSILPYVQILNTSTWTVYECDLDPQISHPELVAYLLVHGDRMALIGEVTHAALLNAAYWFDRSAGERHAFARAAARSERPDAASFRLLANATDWLRQLAEEQLRPPSARVTHRSIPNSGLLVPAPLQAQPVSLVDGWTHAARQTVDSFQAAWRRPDPAAAKTLCEWLAEQAPQVLITAQGGRVVWEPEHPSRLGALRTELKRAGGAAIRDVHADLEVIDERSRSFFASLAEADALPLPAAGTEERGYTHVHPRRKILVYHLDEAGMDRLLSPALPYAREMLGARALHEWAHLAVDAGLVPRVVSDRTMTERLQRVAALLDDALKNAPAAVQLRNREDLAAISASDRHQPNDRDPLPLASGASPGAALTRVLFSRMPDYQANLLASRFWNAAERETYVRHNIRTLRGHYRPSELWRMLVRYLYEYQYLRFSDVPRPKEYFLHSTWFDADFIVTGVLTVDKLDELTRAVSDVCDGFAPHSSSSAR